MEAGSCLENSWPFPVGLWVGEDGRTVPMVSVTVLSSVHLGLAVVHNGNDSRQLRPKGSLMGG